MSNREYKLTLDEAANYANVSTRTIMRWRDSGQIGYMRVPPKTYMYSKGELKALRQPIVVKPTKRRSN